MTLGNRAAVPMLQNDKLAAEAAKASAAVALGMDLSTDEMAAIQKHHERSTSTCGRVVDLLATELAEAACSPTLAPDLLAYLRRSDDTTVAVSAACNKHVPNDETLLALDSCSSLGSYRSEPLPVLVQRRIVHIGSARHRGAIARSTGEGALLRRLGADKDAIVRAAAASSSALTPALFGLLAKDDDLTVRVAIARNRSTPIKILEELASDTEEPVRVALATNHTTPAGPLTALADDPSSRIRLNVARHTNTPTFVLSKLVFDDDESVRNAAASAVDNPDLLRSIFETVPHPVLVANRALPSELLDRIAAECPELNPHDCSAPDDDERSLLYQLARHPKCSFELSLRFVEAIMRPPCSPAGESCVQAHDNVVFVADTVATTHVLAKDSLARLTRHASPVVRRGVARRSGNLVPPATIFATLSADENEEVRRAVAANLKCPDEILTRLEGEFPTEVAKARGSVRRLERFEYERGRNKLQKWRDDRKSKRTLRKFKREHPDLHANLEAQVQAIQQAVHRSGRSPS